MGGRDGYSVDIRSYPATGLHNTDLPGDIVEKVKKSNIVLALTEYSASHPLARVCHEKDSVTRCASLPLVEQRMEKTAFKVDYSSLQRYTQVLKDLLNESIGAEVKFSTGDSLFIDLRNRNNAMVDDGNCQKTGTLINLPSGEAYIAPYEAADDEVEMFGESKTKGILPDYEKDEILKYHVENNKITRVDGTGKKADVMRKCFNENRSRRNIAELGIGCNKKAVVKGNPLEDEKVAGLHIAYGLSKSLNGKTDSDLHIDICFPRGAPVFATSLVLINKNNKKTEIIDKHGLRFDLFE
jgi:leucyl aminopeptidase (aminopeptidase T)